MKLSEIAKAAKAIAIPKHAILIFGDPKTGKTRLAGLTAKLPWVKRIF